MGSNPKEDCATIIYMPTFKPQLAEDEIYHIYNRGIDGKIVFPKNEYYERFVQGLGLFNTTDPVNIKDMIVNSSNPGIRSQARGGERLVDVGLFNLRPTHYHLLLRQIVPNGISLFMQKIGTGFTTFYNLKNKRSGPLFQGAFRARLADKDRYLKHLFAYIALNSLDADMSEWRDGGITDRKKAEELLINARWSSFGSLFKNDKRFNGVVNEDFIEEFFDSHSELKEFVLSWGVAEADLIKEITAG